MSTLRNYTWALTTLCTGITTSRPTKNTLFARGTLVFGATASGNHFYRLPGLLERSGTRLAATIARAYVDDWIITDFPHAGDSAQQCVSAIHKHKADRSVYRCTRATIPRAQTAPATLAVPSPTLNQSAKDVAQPPSKSFSAQFVASLTLTWAGSHTGLSHRDAQKSYLSFVMPRRQII
jgi:hypothetical protein